MLNKVALAVGLVLGGFAVMISRAHVAAVREEEEAVAIVVASQDIKAGEPPGGKVEQYLLPEEFVSGVETAIKWDELGTVKGRPVMKDIKKGTFLLWHHFDESMRESQRAMLEMLHPGNRAIAFPLGWMEAVGGLVRPGDYVDIIGTFSIADREGKMKEQTFTVQQMVKVLATDGLTSYSQEVVSDLSDRNKYSSVVVEVTPAQAQVLTYVFHAGKNLSCVLRRPDDQVIAPIPKMNWDNFLNMDVIAPAAENH